MAKLEFALDIAAPPDRVFAFFVPQRMPYWYGAETESCFEVQGGAAEFHVGQKVRITGKLGRREVALTAVVTRHEWSRVLEWCFQDAYGVRGMQRWEIGPVLSLAESAPTSPGSLAGESVHAVTGTCVRMRDEYELPGRLGRIADLLLTRHAVARRDRGDLARLKRLAERR